MTGRKCSSWANPSICGHKAKAPTRWGPCQLGPPGQTTLKSRRGLDIGLDEPTCVVQPRGRQKKHVRHGHPEGTVEPVVSGKAQSYANHGCTSVERLVFHSCFENVAPQLSDLLVGQVCVFRYRHQTPPVNLA